MSNPEVAAYVIGTISAILGLVAGLFSMHYFRAETTVTDSLRFGRSFG
jgi:hypothetical protein